MPDLILVTGGAGFIGSHLVAALLARGDRVRVLDDFSTGHRENLAGSVADVELIEGDVRDADTVAHAVTGCAGVLHEAAVASVTRSLEDPVGADSITHGGTVNVVNHARRAGARALVLASSCAVYGDTDELPIAEETMPRPLSPYALAKVLAEAACRAASQSVGRGAGLRTACLRYFNVYGPRQDPSSEYSGVIARFLDVAAARAVWRGRDGAERDAVHGRRRDAAPSYVVYGDGRQSRDFVFVEDVVAANLLALDACLDDAPGVDGAVFNVGTGRRVDLLEVIAEVERLAAGPRPTGDAAHAGGPVAAGAPISWRPARGGDIRASQADISRAHRLLRYAPATGLADGLAATYSWNVSRGGGAAAGARVS